jgi:hypothetical protein
MRSALHTLPRFPSAVCPWEPQGGYVKDGHQWILSQHSQLRSSPLDKDLDLLFSGFKVKAAWACRRRHEHIAALHSVSFEVYSSHVLWPFDACGSFTYETLHSRLNPFVLFSSNSSHTCATSYIEVTMQRPSRSVQCSHSKTRYRKLPPG